MKNNILKSVELIESNKVNQLIDNLNLYLKTHNQEDNSALISLISAIVGGLLVIIGQYAIECFKSKTENKKELSNIISELIRQRGLLKNLYRELAMYKTHSAYWWYSTLIETIPENIEINRQDHLKSQLNARIVEREIGEAIAHFFGLIAKYETILNKTFDFSESIDKISMLKYRPANEYNESQNYNKVRNEIIINDENELKEEYFKNLEEFDKIIVKLRAK